MFLNLAKEYISKHKIVQIYKIYELLSRLYKRYRQNDTCDKPNRQNLNEETILELTFLQKLTFNLGFLDLNVWKLVLKGMSNTEIYKSTMNT